MTRRRSATGGSRRYRRCGAGVGEGAPDRHLRRVRVARDRGGPARQAARRPRDRRLRHEPRRARPVARRRRGRRLSARRTSRRAARPTTRSSTPSASTRSGGAAARSSRAGSTSRPTAGGSCSRRSPSVATRVRRQQAGQDRDRASEPGGRPVPQGAHRGGRVPGGRRSALPDGTGRRGAPLRRDVAQGGQRRADGRWGRGARILSGNEQAQADRRTR